MSRVFQSVRNKVLIRDGHKCVNCSSSSNLTIDHIIEVRRGGKHKLKNLQTLCVPCHNMKNGRVSSLGSVSEKNYFMSNMAMSAMRYGIAKNYKEAMQLIHQI